MKGKSGKFKIGIILILLQVIAYFGSILNNSLSDIFDFSRPDVAGKLIELFGFNIPLIIGAVLVIIGRKSGKRM